jgi:hypothetical protein
MGRLKKIKDGWNERKARKERVKKQLELWLKEDPIPRGPVELYVVLGALAMMALLFTMLIITSQHPRSVADTFLLTFLTGTIVILGVALGSILYGKTEPINNYCKKIMGVGNCCKLHLGLTMSGFSFIITGLVGSMFGFGG